MPFQDRIEAGKKLAERLRQEKLHAPLILALPRGGVPVAQEIAKEINAPLDVLVVRKIGAPFQPEFGIGAITEDNQYWVDKDVTSRFHLEPKDLERVIQKESAEVARRVAEYRGGRPLPELKGRDVIVVDDGLATGVTARVACAYLQNRGAERVFLAVPVCAPDTAAVVRGEVDRLICLEEPASFQAVGRFYRDFAQVEDEEVLRILNERTAKVTESRSVVVEGPRGIKLGGLWTVPGAAKGIVLFVHGSGSSRFSPRNLQVARHLNQAGFATLLFDLLMPEETGDRAKVFDIPFLADRLKMAIGWVRRQELSRNTRIGLFGASTGGGAALWAAAELGSEISAVVSRGGRPDLAALKLQDVEAPTLLIVGGNDGPVIEMNRSALQRLRHAEMKIIPGATHLFEEPGAMEQVEKEAADWFLKHLNGRKKHEAA